MVNAGGITLVVAIEAAWLIHQKHAPTWRKTAYILVPLY